MRRRRYSRTRSSSKRVVALLVIAVVAIGAWFVFRPAFRTPGKAAPTAMPSPTPAPRPEYPDTVLEARLRALVSRSTARVGIMARNLRTGAVARVNADTLIPLMSVVKLPTAIVVLDGIDHGRWPLDTTITLLAGDMHPRGWIGDRYPRGGPVRLYVLLNAMLTRSDNSSADALMRFVGGPQAVTRWLEQRGIHDLRVDRTERVLGNDWYGLAPGADTMGSAEEIRQIRERIPDAVHDSAATAMLRDPRDTGSAASCVLLLERLWRQELLSAAMTDTLKSFMFRCRTGGSRLPAGLPKRTPIARKTGTGGTWRGVTVSINDIGVMRLPNGDDVAIAVLVGEPRGPVVRAERLIARVGRTVYDAWSAPRAAQ